MKNLTEMVFNKGLERTKVIISEQEVMKNPGRFQRLLTKYLVLEINKNGLTPKLLELVMGHLSLLTYGEFIEMFPPCEVGLFDNAVDIDCYILDNIEELINSYCYVNKDIEKLANKVYRLKIKMFTKC